LNRIREWLGEPVEFVHCLKRAVLRVRVQRGLLMSLNMLIETSGGFDYSGADCKGWMKEAGFQKTFVEHLAGPIRWLWGSRRAAPN
jgi:hypothetical protein